MEQFVTRPHCDTQGEDTVGINPYTLLCPAATRQATSRRIGREHRAQWGMPEYPGSHPSPATSSVLSWLSLLPSCPPHHTGPAIFN